MPIVSTPSALGVSPITCSGRMEAARVGTLLANATCAPVRSNTLNRVWRRPSASRTVSSTQRLPRRVDEQPHHEAEVGWPDYGLEGWRKFGAPLCAAGQVASTRARAITAGPSRDCRPQRAARPYSP